MILDFFFSIDVACYSSIARGAISRTSALRAFCPEPKEATSLLASIAGLFFFMSLLE